MITLIEGTPGSGKSAVSVCDMIDHLQAGGTIACNFDLVEGWAERIAKSDLKCRLGFRNPVDYARSLHSRAYKIGTPDTLYELSKCLNSRDKSGRLIEGQGRLYLDEAQLLFNSRNWQKNYPFIEFFSQHRKLGWDIVMVSHDEAMIDSQVRHYIELRGSFRNLNKLRFLGLGLPRTVNIFLAVYHYAGSGPGKGVKSHWTWHYLDKTRASLYDSMQVFAFDASEQHVSYHGPLPFAWRDKPSESSSLVLLPRGPCVRSDMPVPYSRVPVGTCYDLIGQGPST